MKQEVKDIAIEVATKTVPAGGLAWISQVSVTAALAGLLVVLQIAYLLRKWWREETEWGLKMRRWVGRYGITKPIELDDEPG